MTAPNTASVSITGDVSGLVTAMGSGALVVERSMDQVVLSAKRAAASVEVSTAEMGASAEGLSHRFEHLGVTVAFAAASLANDSERGVTRAAHAIALLGFAFGPIVGTVTTLVAVIGEHFVDALHKEADAADKAREANEKYLDSLGESKNLKGSAQRQQQLFSGAEYTTEADPVLRAGIKAGGIQGLTNSPVLQEYRRLQQEMTIGLGHTLDDIPEATKKRFAIVEEQVQPLLAQLTALQEAYDGVKKLTDDLTKGAVADEQSKARLEAEKKEYDEWLKHNAEVVEELNAVNQGQKKLRDEQEAAALRDFEEGERKKAQDAEETDRVMLDAHKRFLASVKKLDEKNAQELKQQEAEWESFFNASLGSALQKWIETGENLRAFWRDLWYAIVQETANAYIRMELAAAAHALATRNITLHAALETIAIKSWEAIKWIAIEAAKAAASAWAAIAAIPYVGPALAPLAAAATLSGVLALAHNIGGGGGSPTTSTSAVSRTASAPRAQQNITIQAMDASSFKQFARANRSTFVATVKAGLKDNAGGGRS